MPQSTALACFLADTFGTVTVVVVVVVVVDGGGGVDVVVAVDPPEVNFRFLRAKDEVGFLPFDRFFDA